MSKEKSMLTKENADELIKSPQYIVNVVGNLVLTSIDLCHRIFTSGVDVGGAILGAPIRLVAAIAGSAAAGFAAPGAKLLTSSVNSMTNIARNSEIKNTLQGIVKKGNQAIEAGAGEVQNFTSNMTKK